MDANQQMEDQKGLPSRINSIAQWAEEWRMEINSSKSKIMHKGKNNPGLPYFNGTETTAIKEEKDIGFWITDDFSNSTHVHKAKAKRKKLGRKTENTWANDARGETGARRPH